MLMQTFLSAQELGLKEVEKEALITVLGMLERGEITDDQFKMSVFQSECGTMGCLAGWANAVSGGKAFPIPSRSGLFAPSFLGHLNEETLKLFWYRGFGNLMRQDAGNLPSTEEGARVLRTYLQIGKSTW